MNERAAVATILFTDIEGSSRLWERSPEHMRVALSQHDAIARSSVETHQGTLVKMIGDGMHAVFADPLDAIEAALQFQLALADIPPFDGCELRSRCGMHVGVVERRDNDYFGNPVNRASRIMNAGHGGQILLSQAVVDLVADRLPDAVALHDIGTVRLRDLDGPEHLYQIVHARLRSEFPPLRSLAKTPNNLPLQVTSFIGREREIAEIKRALEHSRFVTLHGPGGIGKSRLSLQVGGQLLDEYADGVWFVELAGLSDPRLVPQAVASVLGVKEVSAQALVDSLTSELRDRQILLILDNCEHLLEACADLATRLLQSGPRLRLLASSRERLRIAGEAIYEVPSLPVPDVDDSMRGADLVRFDAVRLFTERARGAQPAFEVTDQTAVAVGEICRRLDGIPLAIELAAARIRMLSADQIAARLNDRFRLLTSGNRTALPRQQTLRALIDWSYELLLENERLLLARLAAFSGGWTLDAAEAVGGGGSIDQSDVLELLGNLVEKSLVRLDGDSNRYGFSDTVRQYALERLDAASERTGVRGRHLAYFLALAETARPELVGTKQAAWLERLDIERENILAAHTWAAQADGGAELGLRLVSAMRRYWIFRGLPAIGYRMTLEALSHPEAETRNYTRCQGLFDAGQLCSWMGRYREAQVHLEESLAIAREIGDRRSVALVLQPLGIAYHGLGELAIARRHFEEALEMAREIGNRREIAAALIALAQLRRAEGNLDAAEPLYAEALALARDLDDREVTCVALLNLAMVSIGRDDGRKARPMLVDALTIAEETGSKQVAQSVLDVSAGLAASIQDWATAARLYGVAETLASETGLQRDRTDDGFLTPLIASARRAMGDDAFMHEVSAGRELDYEEATARLREWLRGAC